jgi:hypothetical protein
MARYITCPFCQYRFPASSQHTGRNIQCPQCAGAVDASGTALQGAEDGICPLCKQTLAKESSTCKTCGCDIKSDTEVAVRLLPEIFVRPPSQDIPTSHSRGLLLAMVLLALTSGLYYFKAMSHVIPILTLLPEDTKLVVLAHWKSALKEEGGDASSTFLSHVQSKILPCLSTLLPDALQVDWQNDVKLVCLLGNEPALFDQMLEQNCTQWLPYAVLLDGHFPVERWHTYATGKKSNYQNCPIWQHMRKADEEASAVFFTILEPNIVVISRDLDTVKNIISVSRGYSQGVARGFTNMLEPASEPHLLQVCGQFPAKFFSAQSVLGHIAPEMISLHRLYLAARYENRSLKVRLETGFTADNAALHAKEAWERLANDSLSLLMAISSPYAKNFAEWQQGSKVQFFKHKLMIEWQTSDEHSQKFWQFLSWLHKENGYETMLAEHHWQKIVKAEATQKPLLIETFMQDTRFANSPLLAKVKELQRSLHKESKENEAQTVYNQLTQRVPTGNVVLRWAALQQFPAGYEGTVVARQVNQELEEVQRQLRQQVEETNQTVKKLLDSHKSEELRTLLAANPLLTPEQMAILKKAGEQNLQLQTHVQVLHKLYGNAQRELQQGTVSAVSFLREELPGLVARREWDNATRQVRDWQSQLKTSGKAVEPGLGKALQDIVELKALFSQVADTLSEAGKQRKQVSVTLRKGESYTGKVARFSKSKDKFEMRDTKDQPHIVTIEEIKAATLNELIANKDRTAKTWYYIGMLALYEGQEQEDNNSLQLAQKCLNEAKKLGFEAAVELLKSLEK